MPTRRKRNCTAREPGWAAASAQRFAGPQVGTTLGLGWSKWSVELETAARERIPILTILVNNGTMGGYERYIPFAGEKYRSRFLSGDYGKVAEGLGVAVQRVTEPSEIIPALQRAIEVTGYGSEPGAGGRRPALVEFITREETRLSRPW